MPPIIDVQNLSKKYKIGAAQPRYLSLRDSLSSTFKRAKDLTTFKKLSNLNTHNEFWALKDINFQVNAGESIGIIGRNGAGKSTLLKILSRITPPTSGGAILRGRLASLLEVGTGFHPELTGRENVYFNGSILGLRKAEIDRKLDQIVDFSGVERFIDTPLKQYSSGMQLRLAFAVAAHLEPEILIIDEVLAVGDAEFQKKCLGKMDEVSKSGRTVIFVSHQLSSILNLCPKSILLEKGKIIDFDRSANIVNKYLSHIKSLSLSFNFEEDLIEDDYCKLLSLNFIDAEDKLVDILTVDNAFILEFIYQIKKIGHRPTANFLLTTSMDEKIFQSLPSEYNTGFEVGLYKSTCYIPANLLNNRSYKLVVALTSHNPTHIHCQTELYFDVSDNMNARTRGDYRGEMHGVMRPFLNWETQKIR